MIAYLTYEQWHNRIRTDKPIKRLSEDVGTLALMHNDAHRKVNFTRANAIKAMMIKMQSECDWLIFMESNH